MRGRTVHFNNVSMYVNVDLCVSYYMCFHKLTNFPVQLAVSYNVFIDNNNGKFEIEIKYLR